LFTVINNDGKKIVITIRKVHNNPLIINSTVISDLLKLKTKRPGEISKIIMFNPNLQENKSYYMNFDCIKYVTKAYNSYFDV